MSDQATKNYPEIVQHLGLSMREVAKAIPDTWRGFVQCADSAKSDGVIDGKTKELMAVAISIALRCDGCIGFHVRGAVKLGATRAEMLETIGVAVMMNGGPGTVYGTYAMEAYDQFASTA